MPDHSDRRTGSTHDDATSGIDRRNFLKLMGGALGGLVIVSFGPSGAKATATLPPQYFCTVPGLADATFTSTPSRITTDVAKKLDRFVDPLPIPQVLQSTGTYKGLPLYEVEMRQFTQKLHRDLPPTTLWGYEGLYPGPTIEVEHNQPIAVHWKNKLPPDYFLPRDTTLHGDEEDKPTVRTVVHLHGAKVLSQFDGYPEAWFTKNFAQTGPDFANEIYEYSNEQRATALWYHDHALGVTRLNVYAGLAGFYLIRSQEERDLNLPKGAFEIPLVIQDRMFNPDGSLLYPVVNLNGDHDPRVPPVWIPEFFGDTVLVNGKVWPYLEVEPRKYRFRILNGSNSRFYDLRLKVRHNEVPGPVLNVIGTDGGLLSRTMHRKHLVMAPAERYDVIVDFSGYEGKSLVLHNNARAPYPSGNAYIPKKVMLFRVKSETSGPDTSDLPGKIYPIPALDPASAVKERDINISAIFSASFHAIEWKLNGDWDEPITEAPHAGDIEIWRIINKGGAAHPIHLHLVHFQVLDRQPIQSVQGSDELVFAGPAQLPPPDEANSWKDTIIANAREVTRVIAKFDLPKGADTTPGTRHRYVYHCHMIEHEDNEMMRPYDVVA